MKRTCIHTKPKNDIKISFFISVNSFGVQENFEDSRNGIKSERQIMDIS